MMQIDSAILATDKVICKNISRFDDSERGLLSQNILSQLRNFVEYIADKVYANGSDLDPNNYALNVEALKHLQTRGDLRFLHTAITRAKENLKIYWSPETEKSVLEKLSVRDSRRDANLLKQLYSL